MSASRFTTEDDQRANSGELTESLLNSGQAAVTSLLKSCSFTSVRRTLTVATSPSKRAILAGVLTVSVACSSIQPADESQYRAPADARPAVYTMDDEGYDMVSMLEQIVKDATAPTQSMNSAEVSESIISGLGSSVDSESDSASDSAVREQGSVSSSSSVEHEQDSDSQQFFTMGAGISASESEARIVSAMSAIANSGSGSNSGAVEQPAAQVAFIDTPTPQPAQIVAPAPTPAPAKPVTAAPIAAPFKAVTPAPTAVPAEPATPVPTAVPAKPATPASPAVPAKPATPASPAVPAISNEHSPHDDMGRGNSEGKGTDDADSTVSPVESPVFEITPTAVIEDTDETPIVVEPTPDSLPEPTVETTPEVSPEPTVEPTPVPTVEPSPEPTDNEETEKAEVTAEIAATPTPEPDSSSPGKSGSSKGRGKGLTK